VDRAENALVAAFLVTRLGGVRNHHVGVAVDELVEDPRIVGINDDLGGMKVGAVEAFVYAARIDDHLNARPVDVGERLKFRGVGAARDRRLALTQIWRREQPSLGALERDGDPAHDDVESVGVEIHCKGRPARRHEFDPDAERRAERVRHVDVEARIGARRALAHGEGRIVAGRPNLEHAARENVVEARILSETLRGDEEEAERRDERDRRHHALPSPKAREAAFAPAILAMAWRAASASGKGGSARLNHPTPLSLSGSRFATSPERTWAR